CCGVLLKMDQVHRHRHVHLLPSLHGSVSLSIDVFTAAHTCANTHIHTHTHTHMQTHTYTHTHTHTHTHTKAEDIWYYHGITHDRLQTSRDGSTPVTARLHRRHA